MIPDDHIIHSFRGRSQQPITRDATRAQRLTVQVGVTAALLLSLAALIYVIRCALHTWAQLGG